MLRLVAAVTGVLLLVIFGSSLLVAALIATLFISPAFREWMRRLNKRAVNPVVLRFAGHPRSPLAVIHHVGRSSGHPYVTPVRVRSTPEGFIVPLLFGQGIDWLRNILVAGGGVITWRGHDYPVGEPSVANMLTVVARVPLPRWRARLWQLLFTRSQLGAAPCLWLKRAVSVPAKADTSIGRTSVPPKRWTSVRVAWDAWQTVRGGPSAVVARQSERLAELVAFARARSPYYQHLYQDLPSRIGDIRQLPPVTKPELMAHFDEWVTDPAVTRVGVEAFVADLSQVGRRFLGRYLIYTTSGATGEPALLVQDERAWSIYTGVRIARGLRSFLPPQVLWAFLRHPGRVAGLYVTGGHFGAAAMMARRRQSRLPVVREFSVLTPLPQLVTELNAFRPAFIGGYATVLVQLAQEQIAGRLRIHPVLVTSTAETLTPTGRRQIAEAFSCQVLEGYGASEALMIALECPHKRLHVNTDWFIVEPVDEAYQPVPVGQSSHTVLVTNLANSVQPIIRYDLGDSITLSEEPCPCGSPLPVIRVEGRSGELLTFMRPDGCTVQLLPLALVTIVEETPGIRCCQLIQTAPATLTVRFEAVPTSDVEQVWAMAQQRLHAYLAANGLGAVEIERSAERPGRDPRSGKFRHAWAEVAHATDTARAERTIR